MGPKLRYLDLSSNNLRRVENLNGLDGLCELRLDCCMLTEIPPLQLPSLTVLNVEDNRIGAIAGLENCAKLETLTVSTNEIASLAPCAPMKNLKHLYAARNHVGRVDVIAGIGSLLTLDLSENGFTALPVGCLPPNLEELVLDGNNLSSAEFLFASRAKRARADRTEVLCGVTSLSTLRLARNAFRDLASFPPLPALVDLDLHDNQVESLLELIQKTTNLEVLDISGNCVATLQQVSKLEALTSLCDVTLERNPVSTNHSEADVLQALVLLPALDHVNGRPFVLDAVQRMAQGPGGLNLDQTLQLRDELGATGRPGTSSGRPGTSSGRPGTSSGERPGTPGARPQTPSLASSQTLSLSRPGSSAGRPAGQPRSEMGEQVEGVRKSAVHMEQRGVKDPLMFARPEKSKRNCWTEAQINDCDAVLTREFTEGAARTASNYAAAEAALGTMRTFIQDAERTLATEARLALERDQKLPPVPAEDPSQTWGLEALSQHDSAVQPPTVPRAPSAPQEGALRTVIEVEESFVTEVDVAARVALPDAPADWEPFAEGLPELPEHPLLEPDSPGGAVGLSPRGKQRLLELQQGLPAPEDLLSASLAIDAELAAASMDADTVAAKLATVELDVEWGRLAQRAKDDAAHSDSDFSDLSDAPDSTTAPTSTEARAPPSEELTGGPSEELAPERVERSPRPSPPGAPKRTGSRLRDAQRYAQGAPTSPPKPGRKPGLTPRKQRGGRM